MTRMWVVLGDATTGGGQVISGSPFTDIDGLPVARVNDKATCPQHKGTFPIVDGDPTTIIDGEAVALHGSSLACGCKVLAVKQVRVFLDAGGGAGSAVGGASTSATAAAVATTRPVPDPMAAANAGPAFDEQIRFVGPTGVALSNIGYVLHLKDGSSIDGVTDDDGRTGRVTTSAPLGISRAELSAPPQASGCCGAAGLPSQTVQVALAGVGTNGNQVGSSVQQASAGKAEDRGLTGGEIAMARQVFGEAIDYGSVKIHNHGYWLFFGFQQEDTAVAPNGEIYLPADLFKPDFSLLGPTEQRLLIHELTHVWQYQLGYPIKRVRAVRPHMSYAYTLGLGRKLHDYNMEAQGNIIADYFTLKVHGDKRALYEAQYMFSTFDSLPSYQQTLSEFLADPRSANNLPQVTE
ncbi:PAAR domain-containing protein [Novilysobacter erysipheiresistens]|uniref:PAAR domain-containing protein n=1 Tax=Novilysobacter erysipheiresistens TaxID=1749332 RepID=A0ABU7YVZ9_9GAMM